MIIVSKFLTHLTVKENTIKNIPWIWEICLNLADLNENEGQSLDNLIS